MTAVSEAALPGTTDCTPALPTAAGLAPVGLTELVERAALQTRVDRKYVLPVADADRVLAGLAARAEVRVLDIAGRRSFGYESLYLDTPELTGYHLAARGRRRRFKVRRRTYLDSGEHWLEVKTRGVRGATVKERVALDPAGALMDSPFVDSALGRAGLGWVRSRDLQPVLRTAYRRTTLYLPADDARVTVDTALEWSLPGGPVTALPGLAIVETKAAGGASLSDRCLWRAGCRPARISKYGTGLAALHGGLPDNRWHPVLTRHFAGPPPTVPTPPTATDRTSS